MVMRFFQNLGKSLMLPVAVLPVAAILLGVSHWIDPTGDSTNVVAQFLSFAGGAVIDNIPLLFCLGVSIGMAKKTDGTSALAGLVSFLMVQNILKPENIAKLTNVDVTAVDPAFSKTSNVFVGILCGLIAAFSYNKFKETKLPDALSFFSGKRSVSIIAGTASMLLSVVLFYVWPLVYNGLVKFGELILQLGPVGAGIYGFFNRMLIPLGLHHALNSVFWFDVAGINDLNNYMNGTGTYGVTGQYMTGFFPMAMFGLAGAALAMFVTAKTKAKKTVASLMISGVFAAFLTGITEPLEFSFMFLAPVLYAVHAALTGLSLLICAILPVRTGFSFSAGLIDLILGWKSPMAENPWMVFLIGIPYFLIYFVIFRFIILKFNLKTPGREDEDEDLDAGSGDKLSSDKLLIQGSKIIAGLGGKENLTSLDNCATRLRIEVKDNKIVAEDEIKKAGARGVIKLGQNQVQVIIGTHVQFVKDAMEEVLAGAKVPQIEESSTSADSDKDEKDEKTEENNTVTLNQPFPGEVVELSEVPDQVFSAGIMGTGVAIKPQKDANGKVLVTAPASGVIEQIFDTKHAVALAMEEGAQLLIHFGIDTVKLEGKGFEAFVKQGDKVNAGDKLIEADVDLIEKEGYPTITPVIVLESETAKIEFNK